MYKRHPSGPQECRPRDSSCTRHQIRSWRSSSIHRALIDRVLHIEVLCGSMGALARLSRFYRSAEINPPVANFPNRDILVPLAKERVHRMQRTCQRALWRLYALENFDFICCFPAWNSVFVFNSPNKVLLVSFRNRKHTQLNAHSNRRRRPHNQMSQQRMRSNRRYLIRIPSDKRIYPLFTYSYLFSIVARISSLGWYIFLVNSW